jgi:predicted protein tyrosine phosphatase
MLAPKKLEEEWDLVKALLRKLACKNREAKEAVEVAILSIEKGETEDAELVLRLCGKIGLSVISLDQETLQEYVSELLGAFGVSAKQADALLESAGLRLVTWCLRPIFAPSLVKHGLEWPDVVPVLEAIESVDELKAAVREPGAFFERIAEGSHLIAKKLAIVHLKPPLKPYLAKHGLEWADVVPVMEEMDSIDELKEAVADIGSFLENLANASGLAAKKLAIMHLKPPLEPHLAKHGLEWADVVPVLEEVESIDELKEAVVDVGSFLERLVNARGLAAKKLAIVHLKPPLEPHLAKHGLEWSDVVPVLEEVDSIDELKAAVESPMAFLDRVSKACAEDIGIAISASLHVLEVVPGGQGAQNGVLVGDIISCVGSSEIGYDGSMQLHIKVAALLSKARARGDQFITISFNGGTKSADLKIKSQLSAAVAQEKLHPLRCKQAVVRSPAEDNTAPPPSSVVPFYQEVVESVVKGPCITCYSEELLQLPSPAERMRRDIAQGMSTEEQQQQERQNARAEAAAEVAAATALATAIVAVQ